MFCGRCGAQSSGGPFCARCGNVLPVNAPARGGHPERANSKRRATSRRGLVVGGVTALVIALAVGAGLVLNHRSSGHSLAAPTAPPATVTVTAPGDAAAGGAPASEGTEAVLPAVTPPTTSGAPSPTSSSVDPEQQALAQLNQRRAVDSARLPRDGRVALQVSSKYDGVVDPMQVTASGSHTFRNADIWAEFQQLDATLESRGAAVYLVKANDFGNLSTLSNADQIWVTIADPGGLSTLAQGRTACAALFPDLSGAQLANACLPRTLTPYGG